MLLILSLVMACGPLESGIMGAECEVSEDCAEPGVCLKGVCSAYPCEDDKDCDGDLICEEVGGETACAQPCEEDADCGGSQSCHELEDGERVCL